MTPPPGFLGKSSQSRQEPEVMFSSRAPSLKLRLLLATLLALAASVVVAGALTAWRAKAGVRDELASALAGGESTVGEALEAANARMQETVAELVASGLANREVAARLFVSPKTVQYHLTRIYAKLGVRSRTELAARHGAAGTRADPT